MDASLSLRGLTKGYRGHTVFADLSLDVGGGVFCLLGRNGAGKTTLVNILTTLIEPDAGKASVGGFDVVEQRRQVQAVISATGQFAAIDRLLTGRENLIMFGRLRGLSRVRATERADELLAQFGLVKAGGRMAGTYSGGMGRRLDIAASMIIEPRVLFLDEPTTGLDLESRQQVWRDVLAMVEQGTTIFLTTQYLEEAEVLADRIAILDDGRIIADGSAPELKQLVGGESLALVGATGELLHEVSTDGTRAGLTRALASLPDDPDSRIEFRRPNLDDVFLALTSTGASGSDPARTEAGVR